MNRTGIHGAGFVSISDMANGAVGGVAAAAPWWDPNSEGLCVWSAYQPKGAANLGASYTDLSGNGNTTGPGVAPTWDMVNGWKFNGTTQYLITTFLPQNDASQSMLGQFSGGPATSLNYLAGCRKAGASRFYLAPANTTVYYGNGGFTNPAPVLNAGNIAVAGNQGFRNGVADGGIIGAFDTVPTDALYIGCVNYTGVPAAFFELYVQAFALYDTALTAPQVLSVYTAMAAL